MENMVAQATGTKSIQTLGAVLIGCSIIFSVFGDYKFEVVGVVCAVAGIGLRIEAAIRDRNAR